MHELRTLLSGLAKDASLGDEDRLPLRIHALDRIEACLFALGDADPALRQQVEAASTRLDAINLDLYESLRNDIRTGRDPQRFLQCARALSQNSLCDARTVRPGNDYDALDELLGGVLGFVEPQMPTTELAPDMVFYQPTPARHILAMISQCGLGEGDVLVDLGAGLGHVPLLAAICTRAHAVGIELEPAYVACAQRVAATLNLDNVRFVQSDVRAADLSKGTVFYLYTPFKGEILCEVLETLRQQARKRPIRICTFGPCTPVVARESWLRVDGAPLADQVAVFQGNV